MKKMNLNHLYEMVVRCETAVDDNFSTLYATEMFKDKELLMTLWGSLISLINATRALKNAIEDSRMTSFEVVDGVSIYADTLDASINKRLLQANAVHIMVCDC